MFDKVLETLAYVKERSPYYSKVLSTDVKSIEDFQKLPFTSKEDLQNDNESFFCVDWTDIIDVVSTSGSTSAPILCPLSDKDLSRLAKNEEVALQNTGITKEDRVILTTTIDKRFMAGMAYFLGLRNIGSTVIRTGPGAPHFQWDSIKKMQATAIIVVPSFLIKLLEYAQANGIDFKSSSLKKAICIGEPIRTPELELNALGRKLNELMPNLDLYSTYASTEMATAFTEDLSQSGGVPQEEMIYTEIVDDAGNVLPDGEVGELVITNLGIEAMPLVRYKTGDILKKIPLENGSYKLSPLIGRKNYMIKFKGTTVFPQQIFDVLNEVPAIENYVLEIDHDEYQNDKITLMVSINGAIDTEELVETFRSRMRVVPHFEISDSVTLQKLQFPPGARKPMKIIDKRTSLV